MKVIVFKPQQSARARSLACSEKVSPTLWAAGCGFPSPAVCYDCTHNSEAYENVEVSPTLQARMGTGGNQVPLTIYDPDRRKGDYKEMEQSPTLVAKMGTGGGNVPLTVYRQGEFGNYNQRNEVRLMNEMPALNTGGGKPGQGNPVIFENQCQVRRLTPTECERLMGFPDGYTNIKDNCPDSPRYKALGNSWAVPVVQWIGKRINAAVLDDCANDEVLKKEA